MSLFDTADIETAVASEKAELKFRLPRMQGTSENGDSDIRSRAGIIRTKWVVDCKAILRKRLTAEAKWRAGVAKGDAERLERLELETHAMRLALERALQRETGPEYWLSLHRQNVQPERWMKEGGV